MNLIRFQGRKCSSKIENKVEDKDKEEGLCELRNVIIKACVFCINVPKDPPPEANRYASQLHPPECPAVYHHQTR